MNTMVKSVKDGRWYFETTQWKYVLDYLCDALASFSEADSSHELYIIIDHCADKVSNMIKNHEC